MTERWQEYFKEEGSKYHGILEFAADHWNYNSPLYLKIKRLVKPPARIMDVGCGLGFSAIYLQECGYEVVGIDNDAAIVKQARGNAKKFGSGAAFEQCDAFDLSRYHDRFDLVYSSGFVEHYDRAVTIRFLREQSECARFVLAVIPTRYTKYSSGVTDERTYTGSQLCRIVEEAGLKIVDRFGYGDVFSPFHSLIRCILPYGLYHVLRNRFSYAMDVGCVGMRGGR